MMEQLGFSEGERVRVMGASLPKGRFVKLQPQELTFLELSDPKAVLERALSHFPCLTVGDVIEISHQHINLRFLIMEAKAHDGSDAADAINILNTDIEVDFAPPVGYVEPTRAPPKALPTMAEKLGIDVQKKEQPVGQTAFDAFVGQGNSLGGKRVKGKGTKTRKIEEVDAGSRVRRTECVSIWLSKSFLADLR
jgi:ubiquitin fusion degradation protein 1